MGTLFFSRSDALAVTCLCPLILLCPEGSLLVLLLAHLSHFSCDAFQFPQPEAYSPFSEYLHYIKYQSTSPYVSKTLGLNPVTNLLKTETPPPIILPLYPSLFFSKALSFFFNTLYMNCIYCQSPCCPPLEHKLHE